MSSALDVVSIGFAYPGGVSICHDLSLSLAEGEIGCLLGPSGCGKTTVLRLIAGLEDLSAGEILLSGAVASRPGRIMPPEQRRVGVVFQDYASSRT